MRKRNILPIMLALFLLAAPLVLANVDGAHVISGVPTTKGFFSSGTISATGGNHTNLNVTTETQTLVWQGFFGEVVGNLSLASNNGSRLYSWKYNASRVATYPGAVIATSATSVNFANLTANNDCTSGESLTGTGSDRVNLTFQPSNNTAFKIGSVTIGASTACRTNTYVNNISQTTRFEEIITKDSTTSPPIFATRIEPGITGFDGSIHDYQLMVPDVQNSSTTTYYFYVELQ